MKEIYPLSLQIALFFKSININNIYKIAKLMNDKYKEDIIKDANIFQLNNIILFPDSPIMRLESMEQFKHNLFVIQNNNRADYIFDNLDDNIENCKKEINNIFAIVIDKLYDFFDECKFPVNRIGIVETFAAEQVSDIKTLCKLNDTTNGFNINESYKLNFESFQVYDNIRIFNNLINNKIPQKLKDKKLFYIQRDINSGIVTQGIDRNFINIFKRETQNLLQDDIIEKLYEQVLK